MPSKHELETINDRLLNEREQLSSENDQLRKELSKVSGQINTLHEQFEDMSRAVMSAAPSADHFAQQIAPLVVKLGEVIETAERAWARADQKMREMNLHTTRLEQSLNDQQAKLSEFKRLIGQASNETRLLHHASAQSRESLTDVLLTRGWRILATIALTVMLTSIAATYAIKTIYAPEALRIEQSANWEAFLSTMSAEMQERIIESAKAKRQQLARQNDPEQGSILPAEASPATTQNPTPGPTPTPRRNRAGR